MNKIYILVIFIGVAMISPLVSKTFFKSSKVAFIATPSPLPTSQTTPSNSPSPLLEEENPTPSNKKNQKDLNNFIYPNSYLVNTNEGVLIFETDDNPSKVTDWYKGKIKESGMKTTSFVQTNVNGNILNRMAGNNNENTISIEINKKSADSKVKIYIYAN